MSFPVEEKYIEKAEYELDVRFPDSFRKKMIERNGGEVEIGEDYFQLYPFYDTSDKKRIKRTCNSIVHETKNERTHYGMPETLIAIGNNGGGDILVYKIEENNKLNPKVYWLNHETEELVFVANDFSELQINA